MVVIEFRRPTRDGDYRPAGSHVVTRLIVEDQEARLEGDEPELDFDQIVLNLRTGEPISFEDDGEEWARGLAASFRTPYLWAEIVQDNNPLPDVEIEPVHIEDPAKAPTQEAALH
jgi:hypothetical protein